MKRRLTKLLLLLAVMIAGSATSWAKDDVTATYLTDAALENEGANWALQSSGGNHLWNGTYKIHESWHNTFTISQTLTVPDGFYQISIQAVTQQNSKNALLKATSGSNTATAYIKNWTNGNFNEISEWFSINPLMGRIYATVKVENGSLTVGFQQTNDNEWFVYGQMKLYKLTEAEYNNAIALQNVIEAKTDIWNDGWNSQGNMYGLGRERYSETAYSAGKIIYKTIEGLPSGEYEVTLHAKANSAWGKSNFGSNIAEVYANDGSVAIPVEELNGYSPTSAYNYTVPAFVTSNGKLEVGLRNVATGGNWYIINLLDITYKGTLETALQIAKDDANTAAAKPMNSSVLQTLNEAIKNYGTNDYDEYESAADLRAAITALNNATTDAKASIEKYEEAKAVLDAAVTATFDDAGQAAYAAATAVVNLKTAYDNRSLTEVTAEQKTNCETALATAAKAQTTAGADMTLAISNWDFQNCSWKNFPGWSIEASKGNIQNLGSTCAEYWIENPADGQFDYYQTVTGLPSGKYKVSAAMWNTQSGTPNGNAGVYATSGKSKVFSGVTTDCDNNNLVTQTTNMIVVVNGQLRLGVKNNGTMSARWFGVDWIKLTYEGNVMTPQEVADLEATIPEGDMNANVKTNLDAAKQALNGEATCTNYAALADAIAAAKESVDAYKNAAKWLPVNKAELESTNFVASAIYQANIADVETGLTSGSLTDEKAKSLTDIRTDWRAANYIDDILMDAWDVDVEQWQSLHVNTWSTEGDNDGSNFKVPFYEYWTDDNNSLGTQTFTGTIEGLEAGDYAVTTIVRVRTKNGVTDAPQGIKMAVNGGEAAAVSGTKFGTSQFYFQTVSAFGTVGNDGKLALTFTVEADNNVSWLSFKNVNYTKGAATLAAFKQTTEPAMLNLNGTEAILVKDGITYIQDATTGLAVKNYTIGGITADNQLLSGQLYGTAEGDAIVVADNIGNKVVVSEGKATMHNVSAAEAAAKENTYRLVQLSKADITLAEGVYYANNGEDKVKIDNRLAGEDMVLNAGDLLDVLTGITFPADDNNLCVLAPRSQDDVVPLLWKSVADDGDDICGENILRLTGDDVMNRMANLNAGDVLYVELASVGGNSEVAVYTASGDHIVAIPATSTTVEIPVTTDMVEEVQNHGLVIEGNDGVKAKYITIFSRKYAATENLDKAIWLGEGNTVTLGMFHFKDVRQGDVLTSDGTMTAAGATEITSGTPLTEEQAAAVIDQTLTVTGKTVIYELGDDPRDDTSEAAADDSYAQGESILPTEETAVNGIIMTYGGHDAEGTAYTYKQVYPEVNKFATVTEGINQLPVDDNDNAYNKDKKNVPTKGTFYVFEPTKDGQLEVTTGVEKDKTLIVTEDGEAIIEQKQAADFDGPVTFDVKAAKTYYVFAPDANAKLYGYKFTPADAVAGNTAKDIATFKLLPTAEAGKADRLMLNDAVVTYIKGDHVFVEDATGAIDFYQTEIQFYVGQVLNGYIEGSNGTKDNMPVLNRVDGKTLYSDFKVTDKVMPEAKTIIASEAGEAENLARFTRLEYVELTTNRQGLSVLADLETGETVRIEDHFNVFYETGNLLEQVEGIVGINSEGTNIFWPTSKAGVVVSDGFMKAMETELDVTNKDQAKTKDNPVEGLSITLASASNAGSGSAMAGAMTSKGYKLRTANGSPVKHSATFTVNEGKRVYGLTVNGIANYAANDTEKPCIKVTKVEVDGKEVSFEGGEFPAKGASDCGTLTLSGINATESIVVYFDNSNAAGTQLNIAYTVIYGEKVFTSKERSLIEQAKKLAEDREAVAVGLLDDAIVDAEAGNTANLQKAIDEFKANNAGSSVDFTAKAGRAVEDWVNVQNGADFFIYTGNGVNLVQTFGVTGSGDVLTQEVTGLENGTYNIGLYATSHNAWNGQYGANTAGKPTLQEDANNVAYVFGRSGGNSATTWITARRNSGLTADEPKIYQVNGVKVENGTLTFGLALAQAAKTEWHSVQIASLRMVTTAKEAYAADKVKMQGIIDEAQQLLAGGQIGGKAKLQEAVDAANEAMESIRLNIPAFENEIAKLQAAIEKFHAAGRVYVQNVATGKYLAAGSSWGTHAVLNSTGLDFDIKSNEDGTMNFDSQVSNGGSDHFLNGEWTDGAAFGWTVEQLSNGNYTISNGSQYLSAGSDDLVVLSADADEWRFVTVDERKDALAAATSSAPVDATFLIKGANFGRNDQRNSAWTVSADCTNKNLSGGEKGDGTMGNNCAESYHSTFTISQLVEDAPAGTYVVKAQGFYRQDDGATEDAPVYFANDEKQTFGLLTGTENSMTDAGYSFKDGLYELQTINVVVEENGKLTIGIQGTSTHQWVIWDNFQLMYYGNGDTPTAISETVAEPARTDDGAVYNLRGQKVSDTLQGLPKGLYIVGGKKVVVK